MPVKNIRHLEEQTLTSTFCSHSLRTTSRGGCSHEECREQCLAAATMLCFLIVWALFFMKCSGLFFHLSFLLLCRDFFYLTWSHCWTSFWCQSPPAKMTLRFVAGRNCSIVRTSSRLSCYHYWLQTRAQEARASCRDFWLAWGCTCLALCPDIMYLNIHFVADM